MRLHSSLVNALTPTDKLNRFEVNKIFQVLQYSSVLPFLFFKCMQGIQARSSDRQSKNAPCL